MKILLIIILLAPLYLSAQPPSKVSLKAEFRNKNWYPLAKDEMRQAGVDSALQELTKARLLEIVPSKQASGQLTITVILVEQASSAKVTIELKRKGLGTLVSSSNVSLLNKNRQQIYKALVNVGKASGIKLRKALLEKNKWLQDPANKEYGHLNQKTEKIYNDAQKAKRNQKFEQAWKLFDVVSKRKDAQSETWQILAQEELDFKLPIFEANYLVTQAQSNQRRFPIARLEKLYKGVIKKNKGHPERVSMAQSALDNIQMSNSMMTVAFQQALKGTIHNIQISMKMYYAETGKGPDLAQLKASYLQVPKHIELSNYSMDSKSTQFNYSLKDKNTQVIGHIKGNIQDGGFPKISFD